MEPGPDSPDSQQEPPSTRPEGHPDDPPSQGPATNPPGQAPAGPPPPGGAYARPLPQGWLLPPEQRFPALSAAELASWGRRAAAAILDVLIIVLPTMLVLAGLGVGAVATLLTGDPGGALDAGLLAIIGGLVLTLFVFLVIAFAYYPLLMARRGAHNGQTLGKQAFGIRVVRDGLRPVNFGFGVLREIVIKGLLVGIASTMVPFLPYVLNYLWPLWDSQHRAVHDMVASTHVIRT